LSWPGFFPALPDLEEAISISENLQNITLY
jgi:hypothetical protein